MAMAEQESTSQVLMDNPQAFGGAQKLCDRFCALELEELLSYSDIAAIIGKDPQTEARSVCLRAIDMALRKYGIKIICEIGQGYKRVGFEGRREWIVSKGEQIQRLNVRRFLTASSIEDKEFSALTGDEKLKLANEQTRVGLQLAITERLSKIKKMPPVERIKLVDLSSLGRVFRKK